MGYAKLDDRLPHHKKVRSLPLQYAFAAYGLYVASIQFCQHYETDGTIRKEDLHMILPTVHNPHPKLIDALVTAGLWDELLGGWAVHDYLEHNLSASERKAAKQSAASRVSAHRQKLSGNPDSNAVRNALQDGPRNAVRNALQRDTGNAVRSSTTPLLSSPTPLHSSPLGAVDSVDKSDALRPAHPKDPDGLSALQLEEARQAREKFDALVAGLSKRVGLA